MKTIVNKYKQFGLLYLVKAALNRLISPVFKSSAFYILAVEHHHPQKHSNASIQVFTKSNIESIESGRFEVPAELKRQISKFIEHSTLVVYLDQASVWGWGFVQSSGIALYARYEYQIPERGMLLKNLFVLPEHRGKSIGKVINKERLNCIPKDKTPLVFVVVSNKYAIRNLKMYGFEIQLRVDDFLWFNRFHSRKVQALRKGALTTLIKSGFENGK